MSNDLIDSLRHGFPSSLRIRAADMIEVQEKRIAELEGVVTELQRAVSTALRWRAEKADRVTELEEDEQAMAAVIAALREACMVYARDVFNMKAKLESAESSAEAQYLANAKLASELQDLRLQALSDNTQLVELQATLNALLPQVSAYEELRSLIDGGSESYTHGDAMQHVRDLMECEAKVDALDARPVFKDCGNCKHCSKKESEMPCNTCLLEANYEYDNWEPKPGAKE